MAKRRSPRFTDEDVRKMVPPKGNLAGIPNVPNLYVRFGKKSRTYYALVRPPGGQQKWTKIGRVGPITLEAAKAETDRIVERVRAGQTGQEASPGAVTLANVVEEYRVKIGRHQRQWPAKEKRLSKWLLKRFGKVPFLDIKRSQVNVLLNEIEGEDRALSRDQVLTDLLALEGFFLSMDSVPDDYVMRFRGGLIPKRSIPNRRKRVLEDEELSAVWAAAGTAGRFGVIVKLCLLSAQRKEKILGMQWDHVNLDNGEWRIPQLPREKGVPEILPLPPQAIELIKTQECLTPYVFYSLRGTGYMWGLSEMKRDFQAQLPPGMPRWTIHDLRRTARTRMTEVNVPYHVAEKILGHSLKGVAGIYDQSKLVPPMKEALVTLADHIHKIVGENVVPMAQVG